jgi:hypothetical protein
VLTNGLRSTFGDALKLVNLLSMLPSHENDSTLLPIQRNFVRASLLSGTELLV